jgi:hypothetical protein
MPALLVPKSFKKILVIGPIYDKIGKLSAIETIAPKYDWLVFNGGICFPDEEQAAKSRIDQMRQFISMHNAIYIAGRTDYLFANKTKDKEMSGWIFSCPNVGIFEFPTRFLLVMDGGIPNNIQSRNQLYDNLEASFVSKIDDLPWHELYNGCVGYVIANNPLTTGIPQYYSHSMRLGNFYNSSSKIYAQEADEIGLKQIILI